MAQTKFTEQPLWVIVVAVIGAGVAVAYLLLNPDEDRHAPDQLGDRDLRNYTDIRADGTAVVDRIFDGDTLDVVVGNDIERVRILGIDTPEVHPETQCYGPEATDVLRSLIQPGDEVRLWRDASQSNRDQHGRLLRYITDSRGNDVGQALLHHGAARVFVFRNNRFALYEVYERTRQHARGVPRGLWDVCE